MLRFRRHRRAQTAIEVLFITGIILTGVLLIIPSYLEGSDTSALVAHVKNSATSACAYINSGVTVNQDPYKVLNPIITKSNYTYRMFRMVSVTFSESGDTMKVNVIIEYSGKVELRRGAIARRIKTFITNDLVNSGAASLVDGTLYYKGKEVVISVSVVKA